MKQPCLVAFDLDDTLYKERDYIASGHRVLASVLAEETDANPETIFNIISSRHPRGIEAALSWLKETGCPSKMDTESLIALYRNHKPDIKLDSDTETTLRRLKEAGHTLAIITDGSSAIQRIKIESLGLRRYVDDNAIFISEETGGDKHTPLSFRLAEKISAGRRIYIGDNPAKDFIQPNIRGWHSVMLMASPRNVFDQTLAGLPAAFTPREVIARINSLSV